MHGQRRRGEGMRVTLRAAAAAAAWGLRAYRGTAALVALSGAAMLVAALPVAALMVAADLAAPTRLLLGPTRAVVAEAGWALSRSPAALRAEVVGVLFQALAGTGAAAFVVGALGVLLVFGAQTGERGGEFTLRRALGASRRALFAGALIEGVAVAALALVPVGPPGPPPRTSRAKSGPAGSPRGRPLRHWRSRSRPWR